MVKEERINLITNPCPGSSNSTINLLMSKIYMNQTFNINRDNSSRNISRIYEDSTLKNLQNERSSAIKNEQIKLEKLKAKQVIIFINIRFKNCKKI